MTRRRFLTPEEKALWKRITASIRPAVRKTPEAGQDAETPENTSRTGSGNIQTEKPALRKTALRHPPETGTGQQHDPFIITDHQLFRMVARGKYPVDAVFDLHGHTRESARIHLYDFLVEARKRRYRCVLVITGKGKHTGNRTTAPGPAGVLKTLFYDWLREDPFRELVFQAGTARNRHGGSGAFYVFPRRKQTGNRTGLRELSTLS